MSAAQASVIDTYKAMHPRSSALYERARSVLRDELGIPPGAAIAELHAQLLGQGTGWRGS